MLDKYRYTVIKNSDVLELLDLQDQTTLSEILQVLEDARAAKCKECTHYIVIGHDWDSGYLYKYAEHMVEGYLKG